MILNILEGNDEKEFDGNQLTLSTSYLKQNATHAFIASHHWEELYCELNDDIPLNCLKYITTKVDSVKVKLPEQCTQTTMKLLVELYPEKAGTIRKQFMTGKPLQEVI